jgi:hypothetical protein
MGLFWKMTGSLMPLLVIRDASRRKQKVVHLVQRGRQSYFLPAKRLARWLHAKTASSGRFRRTGKREGNTNGAERLILLPAPFAAATTCS